MAIGTVAGRMGRCLAFLAVVWALGSGTASAQASLAGVVKDASGLVLPGVTVEAASPALIEKSVTASTDGTGQYKITNLRTGTYTVTFTLDGFNKVTTEGIELSGTAVITVNAALKVGNVQETITVVGETPVVDVQSSKQEHVLSRDVLRDIPTSRQYYSIATLVPGMVVANQTQDVGGSAVQSTPDYQIHGGLAGDGRLTVDGLSVGSARASGANRSMYSVNVGLSQETNIVVSGGLGEAETAGVGINFVPRQGGNNYHGSLYTAYSASALQSSNLSDSLIAQGLKTPNELIKVWEVTPIIGGPLITDKLWFLFSTQHAGTRNYVAGMYYNLNANDPTQWAYAPDLNRRAIEDGTYKFANMRLTWQANAKNKFGVFWDEQSRKSAWVGGGSTTSSPESAGTSFGGPDRVGQASWNSPYSSRVLFEVGAALHQLRWSAWERPDYNESLIRVTEQNANGNPLGIANLVYRGATWASNWSATYPIRASVSYVTGAHAMKVGLSRIWYTTDDQGFDPMGLAYRFNSPTTAVQVPNQFTVSNNPRRVKEQHTTLGLYAQDSWTLGRATLQGGVRYDHMGQFFPTQTQGFTKFIPNGYTLGESDGVSWNDITPRMAVAYNLTGDGKTAIKFALGKYMVAQDGGGVFGSNLNPMQRMANTNSSRSWTDSNGNFVPDCGPAGLTGLAAVNLSGSGGDICGPMSQQAWGTQTLTTNYDDNLIHGWGVRPYQWETSIALQRQLLPRVGVNVAYFRRWFGNFYLTDNLAVAPSDFTPFQVTVPNDGLLPGGGQSLTYLDLNANKFGQTNNLITSASNYGTIKQNWQGIDVNMDLRAAKGLTVSGGISTGRASLNLCNVIQQVPELLQGGIPGIISSDNNTFGTGGGQMSSTYCNIAQAYTTQYKALGSYLLPWYDVLVAATFQSAPGPQLQGTYNATFAEAAAAGYVCQGGCAAGRFGSGQNTSSVNLVPLGALYGDRANQLDVRFAKIVKYGRTRTNIGLDLYNALNRNPITTYNQQYTAASGANPATYGKPQTIMPARFLKFSMTLEF